MRQPTAVRPMLCLLLAALPLAAADDVVAKAMRDELARSIQKLQLEELEKPYFIAYTVQERTATRASASFGSLLDSGESRTRFLTVEVRVGSYALDNTNFLSAPSGPSGVVRTFGGSVSLPLDDHYLVLRRQIWLATDGVYKKALEDLSKKRAALENKRRTDDTPDFSKEDPATVSVEGAPVKLGLADAQSMVRDLSALFQQMPAVFTSTVQLGAVNTLTRYVNSEGISFTRLTPSVTLRALAATQAPDGMPLEDFFAAYGRSLGDLPAKDECAARIREIGTHLAQLRQAPVLDSYSGPVLFEEQAAAELFSQAFAPRLLATRRPVSDNPQFERVASLADNPFLDKLGARVLPRFLSVVDDPLLAGHEKTPLAGGHKVDDDGIPARPTSLVEHGVLKTLLATRNPVRGIARSTGSRRGSGPMPGNLVVTADKGLDAKALREELLSLVKERGKDYGIVVRRLGNPSLKASRESLGSPGETRVEGAILAYKVFADGREELVRNAGISGVNEAAFKDIVAASKVQTVYSAPFTPRSVLPFAFEGEAALVSFVVPSLLFEDVTLKKPSGEIPNPPVSKHPFFDK